MLFNSYQFIFLYCPIVLLGFFMIGRINHSYAATWLALSSLFFYGYWNPAYLALLLASVVGNYIAGLWIARNLSQHKKIQSKQLLSFALVVNLSLLLYYKYSKFFVININSLTGADWAVGNIILPLGISFFTFTQIAFLVDTYQGKVKEHNFIHYLLFVTYFPHLIAGPVLHHRQMMPQFDLPITYRISMENISTGVMFFTIGLVKKVLLADSFADYATPIFDATHNGMNPTLIVAWVGALAYTLQLYFDFSGYSDMAIGISKMFGINLPINFNSPYKACNIIEFWRRWHITLSTFLRDYLYIPLGGNRKGSVMRYLNLFITMLLGGLWHGAGWTFLIWGGLHGLYLCINHLGQHFYGVVRCRGKYRRFLSILTTFIAVVFAWVFFRAQNIPSALSLIKGMLGMNGVSLPLSWVFLEKYTIALPVNIHFNGLIYGGNVPVSQLNTLLLFMTSFFVIFGLPNSQVFVGNLESLSRRSRLIIAVASGFLLAISILSFNRISEFLYFQF